MTDNEIIKAVECCGTYGGCRECPLLDKKLGSELCIERIAICAFDLINRQKAEIERLNAMVAPVKHGHNDNRNYCGARMDGGDNG